MIVLHKHSYIWNGMNNPSPFASIQAHLINKISLDYTEHKIQKEKSARKVGAQIEACHSTGFKSDILHILHHHYM